MHTVLHGIQIVLVKDEQGNIGLQCHSNAPPLETMKMLGKATSSFAEKFQEEESRKVQPVAAMPRLVLPN